MWNFFPLRSKIHREKKTFFFTHKHTHTVSMKFNMLKIRKESSIKLSTSIPYDRVNKVKNQTRKKEKNEDEETRPFYCSDIDVINIYTYICISYWNVYVFTMVTIWCKVMHKFEWKVQHTHRAYWWVMWLHWMSQWKYIFFEKFCEGMMKIQWMFQFFFLSWKMNNDFSFSPLEQ